MPPPRSSLARCSRPPTAPRPASSARFILTSPGPTLAPETAAPAEAHTAQTIFAAADPSQARHLAQVEAWLLAAGDGRGRASGRARPVFGAVLGKDAMRLSQRPEAEARSVEKLARVRNGQIRVPRFQRPFRWRSSHIIELFDSIYRGFPIGELLFARRDAPQETVKLGPLSIDAEPRSDALYVVDGQQRVVSLAGVLLHPVLLPRGDVHAIWFDLEACRFFRRTGGGPDPRWIPLRVVLDSKDLLRWLNVWPLRTERHDLVDRAIELGQAIREYEVPAYIVDGAEEQALRLIFNRKNSAGVSMKEHEIGPSCTWVGANHS